MIGNIVKGLRAIKKGSRALKSIDSPLTRVGVTTMSQAVERAKRKRELGASQEFCDQAMLIAESEGLEFANEDDAVQFIDMLIEHALDEMAIGMASIGTIGIQKQSPGPDSYPGLSTVATDGQRAGPETDTRSAGKQAPDAGSKSQSRGPDSFPALSKAAKDGQRNGPKAGTRSAEGKHPVKKNEALQVQIYNSLAGKRVRECVDSGRPPSNMEISQLAQNEGFIFDSPADLENFMMLALHERLYPSTGPTKHANQLTGDQIPGAMTVSKDQRGLKGNPKDATLGQNKTGARAPKNKGEAPHNNYKNDGPRGKTQQFEQSMKKICPVCNKKNSGPNAYCGACGAVLPPRPEDTDGGIPASIPKGGKRNWNVETDGGTPHTRSPYGGKKNKHYYLKPSPPAMKESVTESSRVVVSNLLYMMENTISYSPTGVHDKKLASPLIGSVNSKAQGLGVNPIEQSELDRVVGMFQQGETVKKASMYTGVDVRLTQNIANMMGIGDSHGTTLGQTEFTASHDLA